MLDERRKRQELQAKLDAIEAERAEAARKKLEQDGEHQRLRELAEQEREAAKVEAQRARRDAVLARRGISEGDSLLVHAAYGLLPADGRPSFAEWVDAELKDGGRLARFREPPADPRPKGTRNQGGTGDPIPADIMAQAQRRKERGGALYADVTAEQLARQILARKGTKT